MKALKKVERGPHGEGGEGGAGWSLEPMSQRGDQRGEQRMGDQTDATPRSAQAAADLIRARESSREGTRLAVLLGVLVLVVVGMGGYFYVAVYMPWLLLPKPAAASSAAPLAVPAPATTAPAAPPAASATVETLPPLQVTPPSRVPAETEAAAAPAQEAREPQPAALPSPQAPAQGPAPAKVIVRRDQLLQRGATASTSRAPTAAPIMSDGAAAAYELLQAGQYEQARQAYEKLRVTQPDNPDVLLGLAVIAQTQNRNEEAAQLYLRVVELDPRNGYAQAGLIGLIGRADPAASEARLKQLIAQRPAGYLQFALGNLYAAQGRWSEAQSAYFEAQRLEPDSPDYAFNLAVSLEHISQPHSAAEYYQRALRLAERGGAAVHFDPAQARSRLQQLSR